MPLDYSNTAFEGALQPDVPLVNPVQDRSAIIEAQGAADAASQMSKAWNEIGRGVAQAGSFFKGLLENEDETTGVLNSFQQEVLLISDAVDQGVMSLPAARMRLRALNSQYVADNPALLKEINDLQGKLTSTAGLADIVKTGNEETQRMNKIVDEAIVNGWRGPGMSDEEAAENYLNAKRDAENLAALKRKFERNSAYRQEFTEGEKFEATQVLSKFMNSAFPWVTAQVDSARAMIEEGADAGIVIQQLKDNVGGRMAEIGFLRSAGGDLDVNYMLTGVENLLKETESWAKGTITTEVYKSKIDRIKSQNELTLRADPELGRLISASELIGNADTVLLGRISSRALQMVGDNSVEWDVDSPKKPADIVGQEEDISSYLIPLENAITNSVNEPSPEVTKEVGTHVTNLLRGIKSYSSSSTDARDFKKVVEFFASPAVGKFAEANNGVIPANVKSEAAQVIQAQYENVLLPLISQRYEQAIVQLVQGQPQIPPESLDAFKLNPEMMENQDVSSSIEPYWNGSGVEFRASAGFENNAIIQSVVQSLNTGNDSIAGPLNTLIRAKAHMSGSTDYKNVYENTLMERLWGGTAEEASDMDIDELAGGFVDEAAASSDRDSYFEAIKAQESGGKADAKNPNSSATGLYQFLTGTWNQVVNSPEGKAAGLTAEGRTDPEQNEKAIRIFTEWNSSSLLRNGIKPSNANLYAAHFLGADGAATVLQASDTTLLADLLPPKVIRSNPFLKGKTVGWFKRWTNGVVS